MTLASASWVPFIGNAIDKAIYQLLYIIADVLWWLDRVALSIAAIIAGATEFLITNAVALTGAMALALAAVMGGALLLALLLLGAWYALNYVVPTPKWIEPSRLLMYGLFALLFFGSPTVMLTAAENIRAAVGTMAQGAVLGSGSVITPADLFGPGAAAGSDTPLASPIPDLMQVGMFAGVVDAFDMTGAWLWMTSPDELSNVEFPACFAEDPCPAGAGAGYFKYGDPSTFDSLTDAQAAEAQARAQAGIVRLLFAFITIPAVILEQLLHLLLTLAAIFLYIGLPIALILSLFVLTQSVIHTTILQFIFLMVETFISLLLVALAIGVMQLAAGLGMGMYVGASILACILIVWRCLGALKLIRRAFDSFGAGQATGGATGSEFIRAGATTAAVAVGGTALAAGVSGAAALGVSAGAQEGAAAVAGRLDHSRAAGWVRGRAGTLGRLQRYVPEWAQEGGRLQDTLADRAGRARQQAAMSQAIAGYGAGRLPLLGSAIENAHELRTFGRAWGGNQDAAPDALDYLRIGQTVGRRGSSPFLALGMSPSLRDAYAAIGGRDAARVRDPEETAPETEGAGSGAPGGGPSPSAITALRRAIDNLAAQIEGGGPSESPDPQRVVVTGLDLNQDGAADTSAPATAERPDANLTAVEPAPPSAPPPAPPPQPATMTHIVAPDSLPASQAAAVALAAGMSADDKAVADRHLQQAMRQMGPDAAQTLQRATREHGSDAVAQAARAAAELAAAQLAAGATAEDVVAGFHSGEAVAAIRQETDREFDDSQIAAIADAVLLPRQTVSRAGLVSAAAETAAAGGQTVETVARRLGSEAHFGGDTGTMRSVFSRVRAMQLPPDEARQLAEQVGAGLQREVVEALRERGYDDRNASQFVITVAALPEAIDLPISTAAPRAEDIPERSETDET